MGNKRRIPRETAKPNFFLVQYLCDNEYHVRRRAFIDGDDVKQHRIYMVQWGRQSERDRARIIGAGTEEEMRELLKKKRAPPTPNPQESSPVLFSPPVSPRSPTPPPKQPPRKKQKTQKTAKTPAKVVQVVETRNVAPPASEPTPTAPTETVIIGDPGLPTRPISSAETPPRRNLFTASSTASSANVTPCTPFTPASANTPLFAGHPETDNDEPAAFYRTMTSQLKGLQTSVNSIKTSLAIMNTKLDAANRRIIRLEAAAKKLQPVETPDPVPTSSEETRAPNLQERVPSDLRIPEDELQRMKARSNNPGHFACLLLKKMFSELFDSSEKHQYNWFGGGPKGKKSLDARRKLVIQNYVEFYHPEVKDPAIWRDRVVGRINECLRRPKKHNEESNAQAQRVISVEQRDVNGRSLAPLLYTEL